MRERAGNSSKRPGLLSSVKRLLTANRRLRRLNGEPLLHDLISGRHTVSYIRHLARGNHIPRKQFFDHVTDRHPPVLLIHGFLGTRGSMFMVEQRLIQDGFCVISFNLGVLNVRDIRASAFLIHRKIQSVLEQTGVRRIDIVGHSMGGLIGLYYVKRLGGHRRVRRLVMLGSPVHGTWSALLGVATMGLVSTSSWQLLPGSSFLRELHQGPLPDDVEYFTIAAERDWLCPPTATRLEGAHAMTVQLGHSSLVVSEEVYRKVLWALRKEDAPR
ncbi:MAG: alpha/beta fold hydrolase [Myxococcales bacterium]|nr:alpha/beta fold hydrolase [Myxococcota bacterium]MDW8284090.1 alpha/beta fold hydrolase [Myxococcales bacterium]